MSADPSSTGGDLARVEALRRLSVRSVQDGEAFQDLVSLTCKALGADAASIVIVEHDRAWTLASSSTPAMQDVPRGWSLADIVVTSSEELLIVEGATDVLREQPQLPQLAVPKTLAVHAVRAPGGERVGAIEVAWEGIRQIDEVTIGHLRDACRIVTSMLELKAEVSEYGRFIDLTPNPVVVLDLNGAITQANPAFAELLGLDRAGLLIGRSFLELVARDDRARLTAELARVLFMQRRSGQLTGDLVGEDGRRIPCSITAGHLRGPRRHLLLVVHDLSDRLRAEEEHSQLSEQLARAQRLDAVGQIAGGLAHDLNNLLVIMVSNLGLAQEALDEIEGTDIVQEDLAELGVAIERATELTSKLLTFGRSEQANSHVAGLHEVLSSMQAMIGRSLPDHVELVVTAPDELPTLAVDPVELERLLVNLVLNARDAVAEVGGRISIEVEVTGDDVDHLSSGLPLEVRSRPIGARDGVHIVVRDDGVGMDPETQVRAFEPLFTTKQDAGGSGLGLATVLAVVEQADGELSMESSPGEGTTISVWLPVASPDGVTFPVRDDVPVGGARVLVVDPGERSRRVIAAMLISAGYRVTVAASAEAALAELANEPPELLVTELGLPGMPGTRLIAKASEQLPQLRSIAITAVEGTPVSSGVAVLVKPFSHNRLLRLAAEQLRAGDLVRDDVTDR